MTRKVVFEFGKPDFDRCTCGIGETARVIPMNHALSCPIWKAYENSMQHSSPITNKTLTWLDILNHTDVAPIALDKAEETRLVNIGMRVVRKILANDFIPFDSSDPDCQTCGERPALENTQICPECYLKAVNELKPFTQNELRILEADFFNWPRTTQLTYADGRNQERRDKIEKLRLAMLPPESGAAP